MAKAIQQRFLEYIVAGRRPTLRPNSLACRVAAVVFFQRLRQLIASKQESFLLSGEIETDESYFGGIRKGNLVA